MSKITPNGGRRQPAEPFRRPPEISEREWHEIVQRAALKSRLAAIVKMAAGPKKRQSWQELAAGFGGEKFINQCVLTNGRDLVTTTGCVICGRRHSHGWAGERVGGPLSHRDSHCVPSWPGGYYLEMTPGAGHETRAVGTVGCRVLERNHLEHPYREPAEGEAA